MVEQDQKAPNLEKMGIPKEPLVKTAMTMMTTRATERAQGSLEEGKEEMMMTAKANLMIPSMVKIMMEKIENNLETKMVTVERVPKDLQLPMTAAAMKIIIPKAARDWVTKDLLTQNQEIMMMVNIQRAEQENVHPSMMMMKTLLVVNIQAQVDQGKALPLMTIASQEAKISIQDKVVLEEVLHLMMMTTTNQVVEPGTLEKVLRFMKMMTIRMEEKANFLEEEVQEKDHHLVTMMAVNLLAIADTLAMEAPEKDHHLMMIMTKLETEDILEMMVQEKDHLLMMITIPLVGRMPWDQGKDPLLIMTIYQAEKEKEILDPEKVRPLMMTIQPVGEEDRVPEKAPHLMMTIQLVEEVDWALEKALRLMMTIQLVEEVDMALEKALHLMTTIQPEEGEDLEPERALHLMMTTKLEVGEDLLLTMITCQVEIIEMQEEVA